MKVVPGRRLVEEEVERRIRAILEGGSETLWARCFLCGGKVQVRTGSRGLNFACGCGLQAFIRRESQVLFGEYVVQCLEEEVERDLAKKLEKKGEEGE